MTARDAAVIVREFEDAYAAAFNRRDARALAALFTEEATIVTEWGDVVRGRSEFERGLARAFDRLPGKLTLENTPTHAEAITEDVIVSQGKSHRISGAEADTLAYTRVLVRRNGEWRLVATHVSEPSSRPDPRAGGG